MKYIIEILLKRVQNIRNGKVVIYKSFSRGISDDCGAALNKKGLVLGVYEGCSPGEVSLTTTATKYDEALGGKLADLLKGTSLRVGEARVFKNLDKSFYAIAVAALGKEKASYNEAEHLNVRKENIRIGAGRAARYLQSEGAGYVTIEEFSCAEAASEAGHLGTWKYDDLKTHSAPKVKLELYCSEDKDGWNRGKVKAEAQNLARQLEEMPGNILTPSAFAQAAIDQLCPCGIQIEVRDRDWIEHKKMGALLAVAHGSCENPLFLEVSYCGTSMDNKPIILCGMGVTFDSGGLCLKPSKCMKEFRASMAGAAVVVAIMKAVAQLHIPVNILGIIPLCENMPSGMAMRPGDVVTSLNGKRMRIEHTDNEGVVILADTAVYCTQVHSPCFMVDIGTFSLGTRKALGAGFSPVLSTSDVLWRELSRAGGETGDRVWRFPAWKCFSKQVTDFPGVDISNVGKERGGFTCIAGAFLKEFIQNIDFAHIDITGTGMTALNDYMPYLRKGLMTGRPTRTLIQFLHQIACPHGLEE